MHTPLRTTLFLLCFACVAVAGTPSLAAPTTTDSLRRLILPAPDDTLKVRRLVHLYRTLASAEQFDIALASLQTTLSAVLRLADTPSLTKTQQRGILKN
jgi:hypothetical protein